MLAESLTTQYAAKGYAVASGLFRSEEIDLLKDHFEAMRREQVPTGLPKDADPLQRYPRLMQTHRHDEVSLRWLLDERLKEHLTGLLGLEPLAVQTMVYFKPPGARGQALHQDQYYLRVQPGTCMAAWLALDDCDDANGCLRVVPGSHTWPLLCTTEADSEQSFTDVTVDLPKGVNAVPVEMRAGDVLFFNGQIVHGSLPNTTEDRFRRALIGHYIVGDAEQVYAWYHPVLRMDGSEVTLGESRAGGTCGTWVDRDGEVRLELQPEHVDRSVF